MNKFYSTPCRFTRLRFLIPVVAVCCLSSCASVTAIKESPMRAGYGVHVDPGWQLGESNASMHALVAYSRFEFKGGGGHNNVWQFGTQFRASLQGDPLKPGFWYGGEMSFINLVSAPDGGGKSTAPGFTIGPLAGYRFMLGPVPASIYMAPSFLARGKFKSGGTSFGTGSSGFYGRFGLDLHLFSLMHKRGR